jgi:radical SAM superfamily enzyme YgiQ (UPF0313 family)
VRALLISTYEMGRQPFGLASPAAWLRDAGVEVACLDLSRQAFPAELASADFVGFHLPMHTATRLAIPVIKRVRALNPRARLCCYGLYAPLNKALLHGLGVHHVLGGEYEADLVDVALGRSQVGVAGGSRVGQLPRLRFVVPDRGGLPPVSSYATLQQGPDRRVVGYTEASRGCKHLCRHCPVVPVYDGQFRVVPPDVVLEDIRRQVDAGAQHITFGDPDFFNGVGHATAVVQAFATSFPGLTYDVTIKVEHLLKHRDKLEVLRATGCLFVTSAVESFDDDVLGRLQKGHTAVDVTRAVDACSEAGLTLAPTFVAFTPWTTLESYRDFLLSVTQLGLVDHVAPIQLAIRLLVPHGSRLLELGEVAACLGPFDPVKLVYPWRHPDTQVDALSTAVGSVVGRGLTASRRELFGRIWELAHESLSSPVLPPPASPSRTDIPYLNEPWYC